MKCNLMEMHSNPAHSKSTGLYTCWINLTSKVDFEIWVVVRIPKAKRTKSFPYLNSILNWNDTRKKMSSKWHTVMRCIQSSPKCRNWRLWVTKLHLKSTRHQHTGFNQQAWRVKHEYFYAYLCKFPIFRTLTLKVLEVSRNSNGLRKCSDQPSSEYMAYKFVGFICMKSIRRMNGKYGRVYNNSYFHSADDSCVCKVRIL